MKKVFESDIQPFKMCENIYFVGSTKVSVHIIETDEGLVMLDTGYPNMYEQILNSMEALGLDPKNICAIFH
ncbi:MAG: MBL fold metallo-hydrolase, partial [Clostridia bacterium]|nr:MBL fold metallo-hydrolase [Clostridia bacterium]